MHPETSADVLIPPETVSDAGEDDWQLRRWVDWGGSHPRHWADWDAWHSLRWVDWRLLGVYGLELPALTPTTCCLRNLSDGRVRTLMERWRAASQRAYKLNPSPPVVWRCEWMLPVNSGNGPRQRPPLCVLPENAATQGRAHVQPLLNSMLSCIPTKLQTAVTNLVALRQPQDLSIGYPPSVPERLKALY